MISVKVFDPAMCCSTGVCGPGVDPQLARFAADLEWLAGQGVRVERFNLAQQPEAFVAHPAVTEAMRDRGDAVLPLIVVDGDAVSEGAYATREQLAGWAHVTPLAAPVWADWVRDLVGIGASLAANCEPCLEEYVQRARRAGVSDEMLRLAFATAVEVKALPAEHIEQLALSLVRPRTAVLAATPAGVTAAASRRVLLMSGHLLRTPETRVLFFTGKGGMGKTTLACATAVHLARQGERVLLVSTDPASNLDEVLCTDLGEEPRPVPGSGGWMPPTSIRRRRRTRTANGWSAVSRRASRQRDPWHGGEPVRCLHRRDRGLRRVHPPAGRPGSATAQYDRVIFDTAPTGHTLRPPSLPAAWTDFIDGNTTGTSCLGPWQAWSASGRPTRPASPR
ncbi:MAG: arsenite efflux transporter metallochaperone ArsD [Thermoleophilia bacterium]